MATQSREIPSIPGLPLLGNLLDMRRDRLNFLVRLSRDCGGIAQFRIASRTFTLLSSLAYIHIVLVDHAHLFDKTTKFRHDMGLMLGDGLLTATSATHKRQRHLVAPAFQHRRILAYAPMMAAYAEELQAAWVDGAQIDIVDEMRRLTLRIVAKALFDADVIDEADALGHALTTAVRWVDDNFSAAIPIPLSWPTPKNRQFRQARSRLDTTVYRMIAQRRQAVSDRGDLLSMLLEARDEDDGSFMTDQQVRDEVMTLFLAGFDTTTNALAWTWYLIVQHPAVYERLRNEVCSVLGGRTPTPDDLAHFPYLLQVIKESMRIYPPAYGLTRHPIQSYSFDSYTLPAHALIMISPYVLHRDPTHFPDPERFNPDRWTPDMEQRLPRHAYLPFGAGPRVCVGSHFAMQEMQLILATLLQRVSFELVPGQHIEPSPMVTLRPSGPINVIVRR